MEKKPSLLWRIVKYVAIAVVMILAILVVFFRPTFDFIMTSGVDLVIYYGGGFLGGIAGFMIANWIPGFIFGVTGFTIAALIFKGYLKTIKFGTKTGRELTGLQNEPVLQVIPTTEETSTQVKKE